MNDNDENLDAQFVFSFMDEFRIKKWELENILELTEDALRIYSNKCPYSFPR